MFDFDSGTPVEIKCPACGYTQIVDLYAWQMNQSPFYSGHPGLWFRGHPYTCRNDTCRPGQPSVDLVPAWESDEYNDIGGRIILVSRREYHEILRLRDELELNESFTSLLLIPNWGEEADFCLFQGQKKFFHNAEPVLLEHVEEGKTPEYLIQKGIIFRWVD